MRLSIQVPATSANIGPGFDALGVALELYDRFDLDCPGSGLVLGCEERYRGADNLFLVAFRAACGALGVRPPLVDLRIDAAVPTARGLGSSAALAVGGAAAALAATRGLAGGLSAGDRDFVLDIAAGIEGHPDNAAPAVFGGFCASVTADGQVGAGPGSSPTTRTARCEVDPSWSFHALVPPYELSTPYARAALPDSVSRADAVYNLGRAALVALAFAERDLGLLGEACGDRLHQPYRKLLVPGWDEVTGACDEAGAAFWLSGAGPTILAVTDEGGAEIFIRRLAPVLAARPGGAWSLLSLRPENEGLRLLS